MAVVDEVWDVEFVAWDNVDDVDDEVELFEWFDADVFGCGDIPGLFFKLLDAGGVVAFDVEDEDEDEDDEDEDDGGCDDDDAPLLLLGLDLLAEFFELLFARDLESDDLVLFYKFWKQKRNENQ